MSASQARRQVTEGEVWQIWLGLAWLVYGLIAAVFAITGILIGFWPEAKIPVWTVFSGSVVLILAGIVQTIRSLTGRSTRQALGAIVGWIWFVPSLVLSLLLVTMTALVLAGVALVGSLVRTVARR